MLVCPNSVRFPSQALQTAGETEVAFRPTRGKADALLGIFQCLIKVAQLLVARAAVRIIYVLHGTKVTVGIKIAMIDGDGEFLRCGVVMTLAIEIIAALLGTFDEAASR